MKKVSGLLLSLLAAGFPMTGAAALYDRGNGMVYDSDQNLTWLLDANYAATQYAATNGAQGDADGMMTWSQATAWVEGLEYGGYDDWRLPAFKIPGDQLIKQYSTDGTTDRGQNIPTAHSEMAYLWYEILGNTPQINLDGTLNWEIKNQRPLILFPVNTTAEGVTFVNFQWGEVYALGLMYRPEYDQVWCFEDGYQGYDDKEDLKFFAWAVRTGDVAPAAEPEDEEADPAAEADPEPVVTENVAPGLGLAGMQNGSELGTRVARSGGVIVVTATATDANAGDTLSFDWNKTTDSLVDLDDSETTFTFDPSLLLPGVYKVAVRVYDDAPVPLSTYQHLLVNVVESVPTLSGFTDSDGDGASDADEGFRDSDGDGIPDYLDNISAAHVIPLIAGDGSTYLARSDTGIRLTLGRYARESNKGGARLASSDVTAIQTLDADAQYDAVGGIFDFEAHNLAQPGQSVRFVFPLHEPIPANAVYRKFSERDGWTTFVEDGSNKLSSAAGTPGVCPPPGDASYSLGLAEGHRCIQVQIQDGGINDDDREANGIIVDPGAVSTSVPTSVSTSGETTAMTGGGAIHYLMVLAIIGLLAGLRLTRRR